MKTAQILDAVNARFYERFAADFHHTRGHGWAGWQYLVPDLPSGGLMVLDVGCGNGRFAEFLSDVVHQNDDRQIDTYVGLDQSEGLLAHARPRTLDFHTHWTHWQWHDVLDQTMTPSRPMTTGTFHWVVLFGVMHHIYGFDRRCRMVQWAAEHLRPGGVLSLSLWDFAADSRWAKKFVPWTQFTEAWQLDPATIEPGDYLLGWSGQRDTPRYCHWMSRDEEARFVQQIDHRCQNRLRPGRRIDTGLDLNRYWSWTAHSTEPAPSVR
ncbi:MAG: class I SAM-dependent methyltransferase [Myxococcota bacterium]|nr:class I SAM-dependent methyltransferase [Myxococcota bacterium]